VGFPEIIVKAIFWVTLARGIFALVLGLALILYPDKTRPTLINFVSYAPLKLGSL
jgi:hypothetical protein